MSVNRVQLNQANSSPVLVPGEKIFLNQAKVKLEYHSGNGYPGSGTHLFCSQGVLYLTNKRIVYVASPALDFLKTLNVPLESLRNSQFHQSLFTSNWYEAKVHPVPNGGLGMDVGTLQLTFTGGGGFEFSSMVMQLQSRLGESVPQDESLPLYQVDDEAGPSSSTRRVLHPVPTPLPPAFESIPNEAPPSYGNS
ncbi:hypothetical protein BC832DRAFT_542528 [Gaertneriomyces semiglobifer]|nr:hypothetical protein BC832DRAFT_542528 [Gaertneriomyces semiglobifer]